jgi:hypothetical protein
MQMVHVAGVVALLGGACLRTPTAAQVLDHGSVELVWQ